MNRFSLDHVEIEYEVRGKGEPVLLIHPSLLADGLACPLLAQPELAARYRLIHYHRRGYVGSSLGSEPLTYARQAADVAILLNHLEVNTAHIVGTHPVAAWPCSSQLIRRTWCTRWCSWSRH